MNINTKEYWDGVYLSEIGKNEWRKYLIGFNKIKTYLGTIVEKNDKILDIGCGYGLLLDLLESLHCDLTGWDISEVAIQAIKQRGYNGRCVDFNQYIIDNRDRFTHVVATEFLEHVEDPSSTLRKMFQLAEKTIIFSVPDKELYSTKSKEHLQSYDTQKVQKLVADTDLKRIYIEEYTEEFFFIHDDRSLKVVKNPCLMVILKKYSPHNVDRRKLKKRVDFRKNPVDICVLTFSSNHSTEYDHFEIINRCLTSITDNTDRDLYNLHIGCNNLSTRAMELVDGLVDRYGAVKYIGEPAMSAYGKTVYPKYPVMKKIYRKTESEWVVWFDDDSYVRETDWLERLEETINANPLADQFGNQLYYAFPANQEKILLDWIQSAAWYNTKRNFKFKYSQLSGEKVISVPFIHGAFYAINRKAIKACDIPDGRLFHNNGDWTTGLALFLNSFSISNFTHGIVMDNALRRGISDDEWHPPEEVKAPRVKRFIVEEKVLKTPGIIKPLSRQDETVSRMITEGENYFGKGAFQDARHCFIDALKLDSTNKEANNNLGVISFQQYDIQGAFNYFCRALESDPFYKEALMNLCDLLISIGKLYEAKPFLKKALEKYKDDTELEALFEKC